MAIDDDPDGEHIGRFAADALEFEPVVAHGQQLRSGWFRKFVNLAIALAVVALGAVGGWYFFGDRLGGPTSGQPPVVHAEVGPAKVRPDNPGGMEVPDRDKLVYDRLQGNGERQAMEHLLPPPEVPLTPPRTGVAPRRDALPDETAGEEDQPETAAVPTAEDVRAAKLPPHAPAPPGSPAANSGADALTQARGGKSKTSAGLAPAPPAMPAGRVEESTLAPPEGGQPAALPKAAPEPQVAAAPPAVRTPDPPPPSSPVPSPAPLPAKGTGSGFTVQLAALDTEAKALAAWDDLKKRHTDVLGKLAPEVVRADLGTKGIYYRLRASPFASEAAARAVCDQLTQRKVGCMIIRPGK